ncbi:MAG: hypothetical protein SOS98_04735 [Varibaculum sp.]|nr:hypothetical protein [Varibaculum sp.]
MRKALRLWPAYLAILLIVTIISAGYTGYRYWEARHLTGVSMSFEVDGDLGAIPVLDMEGSLPIMLQKTRLEITGDGRQLVAGQPALVTVTSFDGRTGQPIGDKTGAKPVFGQLDNATFGDFAEILTGKREGSRIVVTRPIAASGSTTMEIAVLDVLSTVVQGRDIQLPLDFPVQVKTENNLPQIASYSATEPKEPYIRVLRSGSGRQVGSKSSLIAQYGRWEWGDKTPKTFTWNGGGVQLLDLSSSFTGVSDSLSGQRVGSRILMVLPPEQASGEGITVVIVDILATATADTEE